MKQQKRNELHNAIIDKDLTLALGFVTSGEIDLNEQDDQGYTPLHAAAQYQQIEVIKALIDKGANVNLVDQWGNPPIWRALGSSNECKIIIGTLLDAGADISILNNHGVSVATHVKRIKGHSNYEQLKHLLDT